MLEKKQQIIIHQDMIFDETSTVKRTSMDAGQKFVEFDLENKDQHFTTAEENELHPSKTLVILQSDSKIRE